MNRRSFLNALGLSGLATLPGARAALALNEPNATGPKGLVVKTSKLTPPAHAGVPVAILISAGVNVIDFSGPWGVFESVNVPDATEPPFQLFAVSDTLEIVTSGSGLKIKPDYTFASMPKPGVVVIPAQMGTDTMITWLRDHALESDVVMSVCTGAFKLAKAGLLDGLAATTHHEFFDKMEKEYPKVHLKRGVRFVENEKISTAGGLTSGTDLALRVVERYYGREVAEAAALYMEYQGTGWMV